MLSIARKMLKENNLCVLATCHDNLSNSSLMQYIYDDDSMSIFMLTLSGSVKHENIIANPKVSLLIDNRLDVQQGRLPIMALTVYGESMIVSDPGKERELIDRLVDTNSNLAGLANDSRCLVIETKIQKLLLLDNVNDKSLLEISN